MASAPSYAFLSFSWLSYLTILKTILCGERGMNPVVMIIISPQEQICLPVDSSQSAKG